MDATVLTGSSEQGLKHRFAGVMRQPVLGPLLGSRFCSIGCSIIGITQIASALSDVVIWQCPVPKYLGFDCPGCGLSRASAAMFQGNWAQMLSFHPFAPFFVIALIFFLVSAVLPVRYRDMFSRSITRMELVLPVAPVVLSLLMGFWIVKTLLHVL